MANELSITINETFTKSSLTLTRSFTGSFTVSGSIGLINVQTIGTSDETLAVGDIASNGFLYAKNRDATNYLELGYTSGTYFAKLGPGEPALFRLGSGVTISAIHAKANTASCDLEYFLLPN